MDLLLFKMSTCGPCKLVAKILSELKLTYKELVIDKDDEADKLAEECDVKAVPTVIIKDEYGNEVGRFTGVKTKEQIQEELKKYSND